MKVRNVKRLKFKEEESEPMSFSVEEEKGTEKTVEEECINFPLPEISCFVADFRDKLIDEAESLSLATQVSFRIRDAVERRRSYRSAFVVESSEVVLVRKGSTKLERKCEQYLQDSLALISENASCVYSLMKRPTKKVDVSFLGSCSLSVCVLSKCDFAKEIESSLKLPSSVIDPDSIRSGALFIFEHRGDDGKVLCLDVGSA